MDKSIKLYETEMRVLFALPEEQRTHIFTALLAHCLGEDMPTLEPMEQAVFDLVYAQVKRVEELSQKRKTAINSRWKGVDVTPENDDTNGIQTDTSTIQNDTNDIQNYTNGIQNDTKRYNGDTNAYTYTYTDTYTSTDTNTNIPPLPPKGQENGFDDFWKIYPRKVSKQAALKAWKKLKPNAELQQIIMSALEQQKKSAQWQKDNGQFIPYPATWLNGKRWEDDVPGTSKPPTTNDNVFDPDDPYKAWRERGRVK